MKSTLWEARGSKWIQDQKTFSNRIWSIVSLKDEVLQGSIKLFLVLEIQRAKFSFTEKIGKMWLNWNESISLIPLIVFECDVWLKMNEASSRFPFTICFILMETYRVLRENSKKKHFKSILPISEWVDGFCCATISNFLHKTLCALSLQKMSSLTPNSQQLTNYFC